MEATVSSVFFLVFVFVCLFCEAAHSVAEQLHLLRKRSSYKFLLDPCSGQWRAGQEVSLSTMFSPLKKNKKELVSPESSLHAKDVFVHPFIQLFTVKCCSTPDLNEDKMLHPKK